MEINYFGTIALTKAVLPHMLARQTGHIVAVSSVSGKFGTPRRSAYAASKHALHGFFDALSAEVYSQGVRVTVVCPGYVDTNISVNALTADGTPHGKIDQRKSISSQQCAEAILTAVEKGKDEVLIGGKETLAVYAKRFVPGLLNRTLRRVKIS